MALCHEVHTHGTDWHYRPCALSGLLLATILRRVDAEELEFTVMQIKTLGTQKLDSRQQTKTGFIADCAKATGKQLISVANHKQAMYCSVTALMS